MSYLFSLHLYLAEENILFLRTPTFYQQPEFILLEYHDFASRQNILCIEYLELVTMRQIFPV